MLSVCQRLTGCTQRATGCAWLVCECVQRVVRAGTTGPGGAPNRRIGGYVGVVQRSQALTDRFWRLWALVGGSVWLCVALYGSEWG